MMTQKLGRCPAIYTQCEYCWGCLLEREHDGRHKAIIEIEVPRRYVEWNTFELATFSAVAEDVFDSPTPIEDGCMPPQVTNDDLYARVEKWQRDFLKRARNGEGQYYADASSGLAIALQEIDRERYDRTSTEVWNNP